MNIREIYENIGADYNAALRRFLNEERIEKYLLLMMKDGTMDQLKQAVEKQDYENAFRAAHSLKGISLNMEMTLLAEASSALSDYLKFWEREGFEQQEADRLFRLTAAAYSVVREAVE